MEISIVNLYFTVKTNSQNIFLYYYCSVCGWEDFLELSLLWSPRLHLFDEKDSKLEYCKVRFILRFKMTDFNIFKNVINSSKGKAENRNKLDWISPVTERVQSLKKSLKFKG